MSTKLDQNFARAIAIEALEQIGNGKVWNYRKLVNEALEKIKSEK